MDIIYIIKITNLNLVSCLICHHDIPKKKNYKKNPNFLGHAVIADTSDTRLLLLSIYESQRRRCIFI